MCPYAQGKTPKKKKTLNDQQKCNGNGQKLTLLASPNFTVCVIALQTMSPCGHTPPFPPALPHASPRGEFEPFPKHKGDYGSIGQSDLPL